MPDAVATHEDGRRPVGVVWETLSASVFGTYQLTEPQQHSFARAVRGLLSAGRIAIYDGGGWVKPLTTTLRSRTHRFAPCRGAVRCDACRYAVPLDPPNERDVETVRRLYAEDGVEEMVVLAERFGTHLWNDRSFWNHDQREITRSTWVRIIARLRSDAEQAAQDAWEVKSESAFQAAVQAARAILR